VFFVAVALAVYVVIPVCYFALVVACKRLFLRRAAPPSPDNSPDERQRWSHWLYATLIDVPFFRMYLRLTIGSHLTKWNFQLLGARIGARPFLAAPYTAEPELLEMADHAMLAGNVSLYGIDVCNRLVGKIRLGNSAIVANSCVLQGGADLADFSLLGDLSTAGRADVVPSDAIAVGVPPRVVGRTNFHRDHIGKIQYFFNQLGLVCAQILMLSTANMAGFFIVGLLAVALIGSAPFWLLWFVAPGLLLAPRLVKALLLPLLKWTVLGRVAEGDHPAYGWYYTRWVLLETILWDAEEAVLSQVHGMRLLSLLWRALGARVGANACIFSSSLACEYDLKTIGRGAVLQHQSLIFGHSIERHSLIFRATAVDDYAEVGPFGIVEAGAVVGPGRLIPAHRAVHAIQPRATKSAGTETPCSTAERTSLLAGNPVSPCNAAPNRKQAAEPAMADADLGFRFQNLHEFVSAARENLDRNNWDYLIGGSETETTCARNRLALDSIGFRPRVLRDVSTVDCSATLFGKKLRMPVLCAPIGSLESFEKGAAASVGEGVHRFGNGIIVSSVSQPQLERTAVAAGEALKIFQLYVRGDQSWVDDHVCRAIAGGYDALCLTVDTDVYSRRERDIAKRHVRRRERVTDALYQARFDWREVARLKQKFQIPIILKGIAVGADARMAIDHGIDCVYVSNHGGRQLDHAMGSAAVLPEIVEAVGGRARIIVDGGFTRGTDVIKAISLGADAVAVGRLYVYGLAAAGASGVVRVLEILEDEIRIALALLGVCSFDELDQSYVCKAPPVAQPSLHSAFPHLNLPYEPY
jgi:isopentenyl diphosphate isomerase/L-lactate dehydrogenase-like FMN-dependent dehydrogenase/carbonic anhydrase/acetyltransferase-like protein (isoleucine patch superfamily)